MWIEFGEVLVNLDYVTHISFADDIILVYIRDGECLKFSTEKAEVLKNYFSNILCIK